MSKITIATPPGEPDKERQMSPEELKVFREEQAANLKAKQAVAYKMKRMLEYPDLAEQLDMLYHLGYDGWREIIQRVKDKYPKGDK